MTGCLLKSSNDILIIMRRDNLDVTYADLLRTANRNTKM